MATRAQVLAEEAFPGEDPESMFAHLSEADLEAEWWETFPQLAHMLRRIWDPEYPVIEVEPDPELVGWNMGWSSTFRRDIEKADRKLQSRILLALDHISQAPVMTRGETIRPMSLGPKGLWRYRVDDYRIVYLPDDARKLVTLVAFACRGQAAESQMPAAAPAPARGTSAMITMRLTPQQKQAIRSHLAHFHTYLSCEEFAADQTERRQRVAFFQNELPARLPWLSGTDITELVSMLHAVALWGNKQYHARKIIAENGIDKLRGELEAVLDASQPPAKRYGRFDSNIKYVGPGAATEILAYVSPEQCGIWKRPVREAIGILGLGEIVNPNRYQLSVREYETFNALLLTIAEELRLASIAVPDLLFLDLFLCEVAEYPGARRPPAPPPEATDHDEIRDLIQSIGLMLGFDADQDVSIAPGVRADIVWRARIGNLGMVTYAFRVHESGSIDGLILSLQKTKNSPTVQKVIAVSDREQIRRIEEGCRGLPREFQQALAVWPVAEVQEVGEQLQAAFASVGRLGIVQGF
jgi:mRNA-degrading endonuclease RelE of RelBE toxin-antitoxin system